MVRKIINLTVFAVLIQNSFSFNQKSAVNEKEKLKVKRGILNLGFDGYPHLPFHHVPKIPVIHRPPVAIHHGKALVTSFNVNYPRHFFPKFHHPPRLIPLPHPIIPVPLPAFNVPKPVALPIKPSFNPGNLIEGKNHFKSLQVIFKKFYVD